MSKSQINLTDLRDAKEPVPLIVNKYVKLAPEAYQQARAHLRNVTCTWIPELYLANISEGNIQDPDSDVIGVFGCGHGNPAFRNRLYIWKGKIWREHTLTYEDIIRIIEYYELHLQEELCDLRNVMNKVGPTMDSMSKDVQHYLNLYLILNKENRLETGVGFDGARIPIVLKTPNHSSLITMFHRHDLWTGKPRIDGVFKFNEKPQIAI